MAPRVGSKRSRQVIDLTEDDDEPGTVAKAPRVGVNSAPRYPLSQSSANLGSSQNSLSSRSSQSFSRSAQPSSSYTSVGSSSRQPPPSQDDEPELLDLTQTEDGPPRELYGNLGKVNSYFYPETLAYID